jgi:hypothetical protein
MQCLRGFDWPFRRSLKLYVNHCGFWNDGGVSALSLNAEDISI